MARVGRLSHHDFAAVIDFGKRIEAARYDDAADRVQIIVPSLCDIGQAHGQSARLPDRVEVGAAQCVMGALGKTAGFLIVEQNADDGARRHGRAIPAAGNFAGNG